MVFVMLPTVSEYLSAAGAEHVLHVGVYLYRAEGAAKEVSKGNKYLYF